MQGDIFSGLNDGILSRAEALADISKHQSNHSQMSNQLKHDVMYHHSMGGPPQRPIQVNAPTPKNLLNKIHIDRKQPTLSEHYKFGVCTMLMCSRGIWTGKIMRLHGMRETKKKEEI